jgi:hypothetical protein
MGADCRPPPVPLPVTPPLIVGAHIVRPQKILKIYCQKMKNMKFKFSDFNFR